ncbi:MAG: hypothetical protein ACREFW_00495 [Rhizomicrobium sp.]
MHLLNLALALAKLHPMAAGVGAAALLLLAALAMGLKFSSLRQRPRRPLALIVCDAIAVGSVREPANPPAPACEDDESDRVEGHSPAQIALSGIENADGNQWRFSIHKPGNVIATFCYPGKTEACAAHKAMRRALKDLSFAIAPGKSLPRPGSNPASDIDLSRHRSIWFDRPGTVAKLRIG